ncbi:MAG: hypothetical protein A3C50_00770 [Candidatus Staskawiczbacteria bacterium RIFCSPHIGHO2_02_FULL_43_16]|uniref:Uncharacterized protein n=1 Tax=Candidatus Staskawiczbacteria bacterium RIFCSPHIGHO2_01_FULL_41_41 TaxID=1802203 RepID=A0A1G2HVL2_9BACT|nr:MAG: hypothetical protein A2822_00120 [Candidatus Staskawiczbacteria bacterium RIFCSPHIGHO2_01_FULL_41_41]OGZ68288.1 MAG: hypothetical protein A3C50_00770 [Candidatus Staskawiczbacteria bacterium RIFCSPHIGHO2_02_FULL_43_16]OGZ74676.1 MAG: hypothetical protein A3A12_00860 [Candidatus Staskawiczbacteria bacterium RIFCSPLOWO2_01_FULL_43_17b]
MAYAKPLFENGIATLPLINLLEMTGIQGVNPDIKSVLEITQLHWRQSDKHSGDIQDTFAHLKAGAKPIFEELGYIGEQIGTTQPYFDYAIVCGAYILAVRKRFALLKKLWETGVQFGHLVLCGGKRAANPEKESAYTINNPSGGLILRDDWQLLSNVPVTEDLLMEMVLQQSDLPKEWTRGNAYTVVDTPLREDRPTKKDPSGEDALNWWLKTKRPMGDSRVLLVYSQPQLRHMELTAKRILGPMKMQVDCIGYEAPGEINVNQVLDTIAKVIFEIAKT